MVDGPARQSKAELTRPLICASAPSPCSAPGDGHQVKRFRKCELTATSGTPDRRLLIWLQRTTACPATTLYRFAPESSPVTRRRIPDGSHRAALLSSQPFRGQQCAEAPAGRRHTTCS
jgi:hypothetical protein